MLSLPGPGGIFLRLFDSKLSVSIVRVPRAYHREVRGDCVVNAAQSLERDTGAKITLLVHGLEDSYIPGEKARLENIHRQWRRFVPSMGSTGGKIRM